MRDGGWDTTPLNDGQLGKYVEERARPPRTEPWCTWRPSWMRRGRGNMHKPPPDTSTFSSNDWVLYHDCFRLTDNYGEDYE